MEDDTLTMNRLLTKAKKKKKKEIERHIWLNIPRGSDNLLVPLLT